MLKTFFVFCLICKSTVGFSSELLQPFKAEYIAYKWDQALGKATMELESLGQRQYSLLYQSDVSKFFLSDKRTEHSIFSVENAKIIPMEYHYSRTGTGSDKQLHVVFNTSQENIAITKDDETHSIPWHGQTDNQLYRISLPQQLVSENTSFDVSFINYNGDEKQYEIQVEGVETLSLPYGDIEAKKVKILRKNSSRQTYAWFAPALNYQLVRLQQFKDNEEQGDIKLSNFVYR